MAQTNIDNSFVWRLFEFRNLSTKHLNYKQFNTISRETNKIAKKN